MKKQFFRLEEINLPFENLVLNDDEMFVIRGGVSSPNSVGSGCDCGCSCKGGLAGNGCNCGCGNTGEGNGCNCGCTADPSIDPTVDPTAESSAIY